MGCLMQLQTHVSRLWKHPKTSLPRLVTELVRLESWEWSGISAVHVAAWASSQQGRLGVVRLLPGGGSLHSKRAEGQGVEVASI